MHAPHARAHRALRGTSTTAALAAAVTLASPAAMAQTWVLYDDFSASTLNVSKWASEELRDGGAVILESRRTLVEGQGRLESRAYGDNLRSVGVSTARSSLLFARPRTITAMKATITPRGGSIGTCINNFTAGPGAIRARLFGYFFNAGTPVPGSRMNDVYAGVQVYRLSNSTDPSGTFRVNAVAGVCSDSDCGTNVSIGTAELSGVTQVNLPITVSVAWDAAANVFRFTAGSATATIPYTTADTEPASMPSKRMEVSSVIPQCQGSRITAITTADFDNVNVNATPKTAAFPEGGYAGADAVESGQPD